MADEVLEGSLGDEKGVSRTSGVTYGRANGLWGETLDGVKGGEVLSVDVIEDVVDPGSSIQLLEVLVFSELTVDGVGVVVAELGDDLKKKCSLAVGAVVVRPVRH